MSTISKPSSMARFLTMLFALVMIFGLCAAVPKPIDDDIEDNSNELEARGNAQSSMVGVTLTRMGDTDFRSFKKSGEKYGSAGFNACLGVLIVGDRGAIIGHYAATDNDIYDRKWQVNPKRAALRIPALFEANKASLTPGLETYVYVQINADKSYVFPQLVADLVGLVENATRKKPIIKTYKKSTSSKSEDGSGFLVKTKSKAPHDITWAK